MRLESGGAVGPSWLTLAEFPFLLWQSHSPVVVFWFDGVESQAVITLLGVTEEIGWSVLYTPDPARSGADEAMIAAMGAVVVAPAATGARAGAIGARGASRARLLLGSARGHAATNDAVGLATIDAGDEPLRTVPAWVFGDASVALRVLLAERARAVRSQI